MEQRDFLKDSNILEYRFVPLKPKRICQACELVHIYNDPILRSLYEHDLKCLSRRFFSTKLLLLSRDAFNSAEATEWYGVFSGGVTS